MTPTGTAQAVPPPSHQARLMAGFFLSAIPLSGIPPMMTGLPARPDGSPDR